MDLLNAKYDTVHEAIRVAKELASGMSDTLSVIREYPLQKYRISIESKLKLRELQVDIYWASDWKPVDLLMRTLTSDYLGTLWHVDSASIENGVITCEMIDGSILKLQVVE